MNRWSLNTLHPRVIKRAMTDGVYSPIFWSYSSSLIINLKLWRNMRNHWELSAVYFNVNGNSNKTLVFSDSPMQITETWLSPPLAYLYIIFIMFNDPRKSKRNSWRWMKGAGFEAAWKRLSTKFSWSAVVSFNPDETTPEVSNQLGSSQIGQLQTFNMAVK